MICRLKYNNLLNYKSIINDVYIIFPFILLIFLIFLSGCLNYTKPTPLNQAAWDNDVNQLKALLDAGVSIDEVGTNPNGTRLASALDTAVVRGNIEATKFIIDSGADVNRTRFFYVNTLNGEYQFKGSALMFACLMGNLEIAEMLLENGAKIDLLSLKDIRIPNNFYGLDAFGFSSEMGHVNIVKLLIEYGLDVNKKYENGEEPVYRALRRGYKNYIIALIENGYEIKHDIEWMHHNSEIAHIAADHYSMFDEKKALQLYKLAIKYYPEGIRNYQIIENSEKIEKRLKKPGIASIAVTAAMRKTTSKRLIEVTGSSNGKGVMWSADISDRTVDWIKYYRKKAENSRTNHNVCKAILNCYENKKLGTSLAECVKIMGNYSIFRR